MKFTLSWLKDHLDTNAPLDEITATLTKIGLEVEHVEDKAGALKDFTIAYVKSAAKHPNADRLRVCEVEVANGEVIQVVCGAPNARAGMKTVFAKPGTYIPGKDFKIDVGVIRGIESRGMLCSGDELQLSSEANGILDLPDDAPVGHSYADYAGLDPVIEIALTPNRPDCTGVRGIARDLAAAGLGTLKPEKAPKIVANFPCPVDIRITDPEFCPAFALRFMKNVQNNQSPDWMQARLKAIGLRPINALVDITNYMTFDRARPLHVFDADKVKGNLIIRPAKNGENFKALDGHEYHLEAGMCVITDDSGIESLAGIIGGTETGCDENTKNVLIESALWNPANIAQTGRRLNISSDARYRFERGVDPNDTVPGLDLATQFVLEFCGGKASAVTLQGKIPEESRIIRFPATEVKRLTGADIRHQESKVILESLGFWISGEPEEWRVAPPSWRPDIQGKADLVEEIIRIAGLERVPVSPLPPSGEVNKPVLTLLQKRRSLAQRMLAARGFLECITWSFIAEAQARLFGGGLLELNVANPISSEMSSMRPNLLPGLLFALKQNMARGNSDLALFETGQVFLGAKSEDQKIVAAGLRSNLAKPSGAGRHWSADFQESDLFDVKSDCSALLSQLGAPENLQITREAPNWYHPGRSGVFRLGKTVLGIFGELHPSILQAYDISAQICGFEVYLEALPALKAKATRTKPKLVLSALQPVCRDFAFILDEKIDAADVIKAARNSDKNFVAQVNLFDVYQGKGIEPGKKSLAIEVTMQPREKTMTDAEIETVSQNIVAAVTKATGASLRS